MFREKTTPLMGAARPCEVWPTTSFLSSFFSHSVHPLSLHSHTGLYLLKWATLVPRSLHILLPLRLSFLPDAQLTPTLSQESSSHPEMSPPWHPYRSAPLSHIFPIQRLPFPAEHWSQVWFWNYVSFFFFLSYLLILIMSVFPTSL